MKISSAIFLISLRLLQASTAPSGSCLAGVEPLISGPRYRVHEQFFSSNLPKSASVAVSRLGGTVWCSPVLTQQSPWLQVEFGYDVIVHTVQVAGHDGFFSDFYATRFQVHVGNSTAELQPIPNSSNSSVPMEFDRMNTWPTENTDLPSPVTTRVLRIVVLDWNPRNDELCIDIEALGCLAEPLCDAESPLTENRDLLQLSAITASSETSADPIVDIVNRNFFRLSWCSTQAFSEGPYVQLNFTKEVTLSYMIGRGSLVGLSYVTGFRLEVMDSEGFIPYGVTDEPTVFTTNTASDVLYTFWRPVQGTVFRFIITNGVTNIVLGHYCWNVIIYGCLFNGTAPPFTPIPPMATVTPDATPDAVDTTHASDPNLGGTTTENGGSIIALATGLGGGAVVLLLIMGTILVLIVIVIVLKKCPDKGNKTESSGEELTHSSSVTPYHEFENTIYGQDMETTSPSPEEKRKPLPSSPTNNTYESIPSHPNKDIPFAEPEYDYADATVVRARVDDSPLEGEKVTTGFKVQDEEGGKVIKVQDEEGETMERNLAYTSSISPDPSRDGEYSVPSQPLVNNQSTAKNPLYGTN